VHAGLWALYEGKMGRDGLLAAGKVRFVSTNHAKTKSGNTPGNSSVPAATPQPPGNEGPAAKDNAPPPNNVSSPTDAQAEYGGTEVQIGNDTNSVTYRVSKEQDLQARVRRIGMSLVPAWQKELLAEDSSQVRFLFVAVDDRSREVHTSSDSQGLILVPAQLAARFRNDDQLAAVLADAIALRLQQQTPTVFQVNMNRTALEEAAGLAAVSLVPYAGPSVASGVYQHEHDKALNEQRWRVALELMADAGYDPWQAPEAWRLAGPSKLPADTSTLKYPDRSGYQFAILNLMYKKPASINAAESGSTANTSASKKP
jgi:hypothetical protein